jgi:hypothetical protein
MDVEHVPPGRLHFLHLENEAEMPEHQLQGFTRALQ